MRLQSYALFSRWQRLVAATALAVAVLAASSCGGDESSDKAIPDARPLVLTRGLGGQPGSLDPQRAEDAFSYDVLRDLYEGLTASNPAGEVIAAAATAWRVEDAGRRYVFSLRSDARWSNGDPVVAAHFVDGFRRAMDPATASGAADLLRSIENAPAILRGEMPAEQLGVSALDDHTLEIRLSHPVPYFPDILTNTVASPVHRASLLASGGFSRPGATISNGPYVLAALSPGANMRLTRNPHYWDSSAITFDEIRYEFVADENAEFTRFRAGDLDVTNTVPEQRFEELRAAPGSGLQHRATLASFYFTFNTDQGPLRGKRELREALSLAIDREAITSSVTRAGQVPAYSLVPQDVWNYTPAHYAWRQDTQEKRAARARALYGAAGYSVARPLRLRLLYNENELVQKICISIAAMWKETLGVETELNQLEFKAYLSARADPAQWEVVRVGWTADYNDASTFLDTMTRDSPQNFGRWHSAEYAALLESAARQSDPAERRAALQQAESLMLNDYPLLPVYFYVTRRLVQPRIAAPAINPMNRTYSRYFSVAE
ncbi:MAG: peptide ABC transporter substrate-binding protein [Woeseiaceae bacterium]